MNIPKKDPTYLALTNRVGLRALREQGWPIGDTLRIWEEWRWEKPPFAFCVEWTGDDLTTEQMEWLEERNAFGHLQMLQHANRDKSPFKGLIVYDQTPQQKPPVLYHATPSSLWDEKIRHEGLKPGRLTGVKTTDFRDSERWIHLFSSADVAKDRWLLLPESTGKIPPGDYTILRIKPGWDGDMTWDPYARHAEAYITRADAISAGYLEVETTVVVPSAPPSPGVDSEHASLSSDPPLASPPTASPPA